MLNNVFSLVAVLVVMPLDSSQMIVPVVLPPGRNIETNCSLSENATLDYYMVRDFIFTFLNKAENDMRKMSVHEKRIDCQFAKGNLSELIAKGKIDWENCLTGNFAYFGDFVNDTLQNFLNFFCEDSNEHIDGYFNEDGQNCRAEIKKPFFDNCLVKLLAEEQDKLNYDLSFDNFLIPGKKDNFCRKLLDIGPCTTNILETHCNQMIDYQQLSAKLYAQTIKPCDGYVSYISAARIAGWILIFISIIACLVVRFCPVRQWYADFMHRTASTNLVNSKI